MDDEPDFADLTATVLEREDARFSVETASSVDEGLRLLADGEFDCIVSDYDMPETNGVEFLEAVHEERPGLPFVLFTGKGSEEVASEAISAGVTDYLQKEIGTDQYAVLANRIDNAVNARRTERERRRLERDRSDISRALWELHEVTADTTLSHEDKIHRVLGIGVEHLGLSFGYLTRIEGDGQRIVDAVGAHRALRSGERQPIDETYCRKAVEAESSLVIEDALEEGWEDDPAYDRFGFRCYVGSPVRVSRETRGTICFADAEPRDGSIDEHVESFVALLAQWVGAAIERNRRERKLEAARRRFDAVFNSPVAFMALLEPDGTVAAVNETALAFVGRSSDDVHGKPFWETPWWTHSETLQSDLRSWIDRAADGELVRFEADHHAPDGDEVAIDGVLHSVRDDDGAVVSVLAAGRDITERKRYERQLERQNGRLETFVDVLAHDVPNHLSVADGHLELAREAEAGDHLGRVESAHERIGTLVEDMQALVRAGTRIETPEWVRLSSVAGPCWESCCPETGPATLRIESDGRIRADESRLKQLFENLYWNAREHVGDGVTVRVGLVEEGFYVADDGPGIPDEERGDVLAPGFTTAEGDHSGFGLAIVREIVEAHGWDVRVGESDRGGVRFDVSGVAVERR